MRKFTFLFLILATVTSFAQVPTGAINGVFSVGECSQVYFSRGNLQYKASTSTWRFAANQWDYIGDDNANISPTYSGWIDLFGYGTGNNPSNQSTSNSSYSTFVDWGVNPISNGGGTANLWRTLTRDEWNYLMFTRTTASGIRYAKATVNGKPGVIILPDDWETSYYTIGGINNDGVDFTVNTITSANWTSMFEAHGAVFLPRARNRNGTSVASESFTKALYWSSTPKDSDKSYRLHFGKDFLYVSGGERCQGHSVRLVQPVPKSSYSIEGNPCTIEGGTVTGANTYQQCQTCTLTATANEGYIFTCWTENDEVVSTDAVYTFAVDGNRNLLAVFTENVTLEPVTACDSYVWHGETYTQSGTFTFDTLTTDGCPRHETLVLTINASQSETYTETACDEYTWHGTPYTESGTYTYDSTLTNGCHRIETLGLTINESQAETFTEIACDIYTWHNQTYEESGIYAYDSTLTNGCHRTETLNLTIPVVEAVITGVTEIELGNETTLTAEGGVGYVWSTGDTTQYITVSPDADTSYSVTVTDANGCTAITEVTVHVTEGINEVENDVKIYPNPTKNIVNIEANGITRIKLFDMMGQVLLEKQVQGNNTQIDLRQYAIGQYFVQINTEKTSIAKKVVKK